MSVQATEILTLCEQLPEAQRAEVADFARFLLAKNEDAAWEQAIANSRPRPKLDSFLKESAIEGAQPLDVSQL